MANLQRAVGRQTVHAPYSRGETSLCPDDDGRPSAMRKIHPSYVDLSRLYFARLAGFLPAVLPGTIEGVELVADGLGLTALGFLASRLLRFWLLAMLFSTAVGELSNSDRDQVRRDRSIPAFLPCLNDGAIDYFAGGSAGRSPLPGLGAGAGRATSPPVLLLSFASDHAAIVAALSSAFVMELKDSPI